MQRTVRLKYQMVFWALAFAAFLAFVYLFKGVLLPFVLGAAVAYLLNPLVNAMGRLKIGRSPAAVMILGGFFLIILSMVAILSPLAYQQFAELIRDVPGYAERLIDFIEPYTQQALSLIGQGEDVDVRALLSEHGGAMFGQASGAAASVLGGLAASGQAALDVISILVFMPLVAYFLIKEWPKVTAWVEDLLPREHEGTIKGLLKEIDAKLSGFVRGQISVAVFLGVIYAFALTVAGLKYGFLIGLCAGALSVIPMVGSTIGLIVSVAVAWFQSGELSFVAIIAGIFIGGQLLEGNFLTPKFVGDSVGLHPLWVFFALLAGGALFGIVGMFLAVPVAAVAGVLLAFLIGIYKRSAYYGNKTSARETPEKACDDA